MQVVLGQETVRCTNDGGLVLEHWSDGWVFTSAIPPLVSLEVNSLYSLLTQAKRKGHLTAHKPLRRKARAAQIFAEMLGQISASSEWLDKCNDDDIEEVQSPHLIY